MKSLIQRKKATPLFVVTLLLACFGLTPLARAVMPPPDGDYPGGNTAEGQSALFSLTTGGFNTAIGFLSQRSDTTGELNTAIGAGALLANTEAVQNTATGAASLLSNAVGSFNTANGTFALVNNISGESNTAIGDSALYSNNASGNTATGVNALYSNTEGDSNAAFGDIALYSNTTGAGNTAVGSGAVFNNTVGYENTAIGGNALSNNTTGNNNIAVGFLAGINVTTASHVISIGADGNNVSDSCYIGNIWQQPGGSQAVYVNSLGKLGAEVSSRRFKDEIKPMEQTSEVIYALRPVSFRYKPEIEPTRPLGFGLIAEEVETISSDLVMRDADGRPNSVRYEAVNAMLLNEFIKEHRKVERLEKQIEALTAGLQKVSAQLELSKFAPQTVLNQ